MMTWDEVCEIVDFLQDKGVCNKEYMTLVQLKKVANSFTLNLVRQYRAMEKANAQVLMDAMETKNVS